MRARDGVEVRRATLDDVEAVRAVGHATWPSTYGPLRGDAYVEDGLARWWSGDVVRRGITDLVTLVAVSEDGTVVGCAVLGPIDDGVKLYKLYVVPPAQGTGAGHALLEAALAAVPADTRTVRLDHAEGNDRAHAFYARHGFVETGRTGPPEDRAVEMARHLP